MYKINKEILPDLLESPITSDISLDDCSKTE